MGNTNGHVGPQTTRKATAHRKRAFFQPHQTLVLAVIPAIIGMLIARPALLAMSSAKPTPTSRFSILRMGSQAYGSINNFDAVNDTGTECHGFEIEIDGCYSRDITYTYDYNHYGTPRITEDISNPLSPKVFVRYESGKNPDGSWKAYTAIPAGPVLPTDGHQFVNPNVNFGGEHFGVGFYGAPKGIKYSWLKDDGAGNLAFAGAVDIATPSFNYIPAVNDVPAQVQAVIVPPPPQVPVLEFGPASWVKETSTTTHNNGKVELRDLVSDDPDNANDRNWRNGEPDEVEVEWQILQKDFNKQDGGVNGKLEGAPEDLNNGDEVVTRRYDFFTYVGPIDAESGEALCENVGPDGIHGIGTKTINGVLVDLSTVVVVGDYVGAQMAAFDAAGKVGVIDHLQEAELNEAYPDRNVVIGGPNPVQITQTGALPAGMVFDEVTGVLTGTPRAAGTFSITVNAVDTIGGNVTKTLALKVNGPNVGVATLSSVALDRSVSVSGQNRLLTVSLAAPAASDTIVSLSSDNAGVDVPADVTVTAGQSSVTTLVATGSVASITTVQLSASLGAQLVSTQLTLLPPMPRLRISPPSTFGGTTVKGTVILSGAAPVGGLVLELESDDLAAVVPVSVTVPAGQRTVDFNVVTSKVLVETFAYVTATLDEVSVDASITVKPQMIIPTGLTLPVSVIGGTGGTGQVTLSENAPVGGQVVELVSNSASLMVPLTVTVAAGQKTADFTFTTSIVPGDVTAGVIVKANGGQKTATLLLTVRPLGTLVASPDHVAGKSVGSATLTLGAPAAVATVVSVTSSNSALLPGVKTVTIAKGASIAVIKFTTALVLSDTNVQLICSAGGLDARVGVTVLAARPKSLSVLPSAVMGGKSAVGTVTLTSVAPVGGQVVTLSSSDSAVQVPAAVTVPAGKSIVVFTLTSAVVQSSRDVQIVASCNGSNVQAALRVSILTVASVVCKPAVVNGGVKTACLITLTGPVPVGGLIVQLLSDKASVVVPASVVIPAGKTSGTFTATTLVVGARVDAEITATLSGESVDGVLSVLPPVVASVVISPNRVIGGTVTSGVVKLAKAVSVAVTVELSSNVALVAGVPQSVVIPAGAVSAAFQVTTQAVLLNKTVTISAKTGITTRTGTLTVLK